MRKPRKIKPKPSPFCYRAHCSLPRSCRKAGDCVLRESDKAAEAKAAAIRAEEAPP